MPRLTLPKVFEQVCINQFEEYEEAIRAYKQLLPKATHMYKGGSDDEDVMYEWCLSFLQVSKPVLKSQSLSIAS